MTGQAEISAEIGAIQAGYQRAGLEESQPRLDYPPYRSSVLRHPKTPYSWQNPRPPSCRRPVSGRTTSPRSTPI